MDIEKALQDGYSPEEVMGELSNRGVTMNYKQAISDGHNPMDVLKEMNGRLKSTIEQPQISGQADVSGLAKAESEMMSRPSTLGEKLKKRYSDIEAEGWVRNPLDIANNYRSAIRQVKSIIGAGYDIIGTGFSQAYEHLVPDATKERIEHASKQYFGSEEGQMIKEAVRGGVEKYQAFKEQNPEIAKDWEASANILSALPVGKYSKEIYKTMRGTAGKRAMAESVRKLTTNKRIAQSIDNKIHNEVDYRIRQMKITASDVKTNPNLFRKNNAEAIKNITAMDNIVDDFGNSVLKYVDDMTGKVSSGLPKTAEQMVDAIDITKKHIWNKSQVLLESSGIPLEVSTEGMVKRLTKLRNLKHLQDNLPTLVNRIDDEIERLLARGKYSFAEAQESLAFFNTRVKQFKTGKSFNLNDLDDSMLSAIKVDALSSSMDDVLTKALSKGISKEYFDLRKAYGSLKQMENMMVRTAKKLQAVPSIRGFSFGDFVTGGFGTYAFISWNPKLLAAVVASRAVSGLRRWRTGIDRNIRTLFHGSVPGSGRKGIKHYMIQRGKLRLPEPEIKGNLIIHPSQYERGFTMKPGTPDYVMGGKGIGLPYEGVNPKLLAYNPDVSNVNLTRGRNFSIESKPFKKSGVIQSSNIIITGNPQVDKHLIKSLLTPPSKQTKGQIIIDNLIIGGNQ